MQNENKKNNTMNTISTIQDKLDILTSEAHQALKSHKSNMHKVAHGELEEYIECQIALERVVTLFITAEYILDRRGK